MTSLQQKMFAELRDKKAFEAAQQSAYEYIDTVLDRNVFPTQQALDDLKVFEESLPETTTSAVDTINLLSKYGSPATVALLGGRYFGFVNGGAVPAGLAAKTLATFWDQNTGLQVLSPVASKLEHVVENWLKSIFNLPKATVAGFVSGTSAANLCGLAAARYRLMRNVGIDINQDGMTQNTIRVVASKEAHATVFKALAVLGFGQKNITLIETDANGSIRPDLVPDLDNRTFLILQAGNVHGGAFDPFTELCSKAKDAGAWVHIDGAFGLWAAASGKTKHHTKGIELANSWAVDGHKTLNTPYDSGIVLCADREAIVSALHLSGGYIMIGDERDGMFYTPEMSRRARIVELWATMKYLGREGIDQMITCMYDRTLQFAEGLRKIKGYTVMNDVVFNQLVVCCDSDEITLRVIKRIQEQHDIWVGGSTWKNRKVIRISVCSWATTEEDIQLSLKSFENALR